MDLKGESGSSTIIMENFSSSLTSLDESSDYCKSIDKAKSIKVIGLKLHFKIY